MKHRWKGTLKDFKEKLLKDWGISDDEVIEIHIGDIPTPKSKAPTKMPPMKLPTGNTTGRIPTGTPFMAPHSEGIDRRVDYCSDVEIPEEHTGHPYDVSIPVSPVWFKTKLRSIFKDNKIGRTVANKTCGKLDMKRLYKVMTSDKLFCKKEDISKKQYNVLLLVDASGSMDGSKMYTALQCMGALIRDMQDVVSLEVAIFNGRYKTLKRFDEKVPNSQIRSKILEPTVAHLRSFGGMNHDHIAVKKAGESLSKRVGQKILLVLSDGQPACDGGRMECDEDCGSYGSDSSSMWKSLKHNIKCIENSGVTVLSIGILTDAVKHFYTHYEIIHNISGLYDTISSYMARYVKRIPTTV